MHKIGIISHKGHRNFGNILQLTALSETLKDLGYDPVIANYSYHAWIKPFQSVGLMRLAARKIGKRLRRNTEKPREVLYNEVKHEKFCRFYDRWTHLSMPVETASELFYLAENCNAFICGSDQIWAPMWYDPHFFWILCRMAPRKFPMPQALAGII